MIVPIVLGIIRGTLAIVAAIDTAIDAVKPVVRKLRKREPPHITFAEARRINEIAKKAGHETRK